MKISLKELQTFINIKNVILLILSILLIYILISVIYKYKNRDRIKEFEKNENKSNTKLKQKNKKKCNNDSCLDKHNYNNCPCSRKKSKELFTMAQSVFPLHYPTIPAYSQILNENMANITDNYMENITSHPETRSHPSIETTTGLFNVLPKKHLSSCKH